MKENIIETYLNYLHAVRMHEEYGDLYGDTDDIIKYYENKINKYLSNTEDINKKNKSIQKAIKRLDKSSLLFNIILVQCQNIRRISYRKKFD